MGGKWRMVLAAAGVLALLPLGQILAGPLGADDQCVPAGLPAFRTWELRAAKSIAISDENHQELPGLWAFYTAAEQRIATIWVGNLLVSVDPEPSNPAAPGWHDRGAVLSDTTLRAVRKQACDWFQPPPDPEKAS